MWKLFCWKGLSVVVVLLLACLWLKICQCWMLFYLFSFLLSLLIASRICWRFLKLFLYMIFILLERIFHILLDVNLLVLLLEFCLMAMLSEKCYIKWQQRVVVWLIVHYQFFNQTCLNNLLPLFIYIYIYIYKHIHKQHEGLGKTFQRAIRKKINIRKMRIPKWNNLIACQADEIIFHCMQMNRNIWCFFCFFSWLVNYRLSVKRVLESKYT